MPLLDLKTNLKSLKYGQDQPGGGDSGQPYIKTDINTVDRDINRLRLTKFDDGLVRGGIIGTTNAAITDTLRIGKFLVDFPKGPLFITKQIGLQLSNPKIEHKLLPTNYKGSDKPTKGQGFFNNVGNFFTNVGTNIEAAVKNTANKIENEVGPTRIYNLGINTLAQVPINAIGGHIVRHGFLPNNDESKYYFNVVRDNNFANGSNRLLRYSRELLGNSNDIDSYLGGPNSTYGIGYTTIRRRGNYIWLNQDTTVNEFATTGSFTFSKIFAGRTRNEEGNATDVAFGLDRLLGVSNQTGSIFSISGSTPPLTNDDTYIPVNLNNRVASLTDKDNLNKVVFPPANISSTIDYGVSNQTGSIFSDKKFTNLPNLVNPNNPFLFYPATKEDKNKKQYTERKQDLPKLENKNDTASGSGPSSYPKTDASSLENKDGVLELPSLVFNYTNPSLRKYSEILPQIEKIQKKPTTRNNYINRGSKDYKYNTAANKLLFSRSNDTNVNKDEIKLSFTPIDPFTGKSLGAIRFLAYINTYSDSFDSGWGDVKYVGRAEKFYIFNDFQRTVSLDFTIPCFNQKELAIKHTELKKLASILAGKYQNQNLLGGIITKIKIGNYVDNQYCIITNLKFDPIQDSSWDLDYSLAFYIKVSLSITVIHDFLPQHGESFITISKMSSNTAGSNAGETPTTSGKKGEVQGTPKGETKSTNTTEDELLIPYKAPQLLSDEERIQYADEQQRLSEEMNSQTPQTVVNNSTPNPNTNSVVFGDLRLTPTTTYNTVSSTNFPTPPTPGNFYVTDGSGNIVSENDSNGNVVTTFNPPKPPNSF